MKIQEATIRSLGAYSRSGRFIPENDLASYCGGLVLVPIRGYIKWFADWEQLGQYLREREEAELNAMLGIEKGE